MNANSPRWWQRLIPRYGNWGGVGWSGGRWNNNPDRTNWLVAAVDDMDALFKAHDLAYQTGGSWLEADTALLRGLCTVQTAGLYAECYRVGAAVVFGANIIRMAVFGDRRNAFVRTVPIPEF